jgi:hypothetical protein
MISDSLVITLTEAVTLLTVKCVTPVTVFPVTVLFYTPRVFQETVVISKTNKSSFIAGYIKMAKSYTAVDFGKTILLQTWTGPEGSRRLNSQISRHSAHEGGNVVSPTHRQPIHLRNYSRYSYLLETESTQGS